MDPKTTRDILRRLNALERQSVRLRIGEVTDDSPLAVALGGSDVSYSAVSRAGSYTPTIGDRVAVQIRGNDLLVLCEIV